MTKAQKKMLLVVSAVLGLVFIALVVIVPLLTLPIDASVGYTNFYNFFVDIKTNVNSDIAFYAFVLAILAIGYYFLVYRPKLSGKRR